MAQIQTNKCPNCGGAINFDSASQKMNCPYCDTEFDIQAIQEDSDESANAVEENMAWETHTGDGGDDEWTNEDGVSAYSCQSCGGEIIADDTRGATFCPYCSNPVIIPIKFSGMVKPDYVIPFKFDQEYAKEQLRKFLKGKLLLPSSFKDENRIKDITGLYVPYWLFDCDADAHIKFKATKVKSWSTGSYRYTKTSHYSLVRSGEVGFTKIPVDGSSKIENRYSEAIEPFDYNMTQPFQTAYLTGYLADKYDVSAQDCIPRANERIKTSTENAFRNTADGYSSVIVSQSNINFKHGTVKYAMLPMWILNSKYQDKIYTFAMNGQSGKFVGELPIDWKKFWLYFAGISVALTAILIPILMLLLGD